MTLPQMEPIFADRADAARALARELEPYRERPDTIVLGLPRGGVTVAAEVARILDLPLDVFTLRELPVPGVSDLAFGMITSGEVSVLDRSVVHSSALTDSDIRTVQEEERRELLRIERTYRGDRHPVRLEGRSAILVDEGLASDTTMRAAVAAVRQQGARWIVVGVPVAPLLPIKSLREEADAVVCPEMREPFLGVSRWYEDFPPIGDEDIKELLTS